MGKNSIPSLKEQMTNLKQMDDKNIEFSIYWKSLTGVGLCAGDCIVPSKSR